MTNRFNLPDINFLEKDPDLIEREMLLHIEEKTGLALKRADPRRKFLQALVAFVTVERNRLEFALRQNRLAYAVDDTLDHMGFELSTERLPAKPAKTTFAFTLEDDRPNEDYVINAGELVAVGDVYFATDHELIIPAGESIGVVTGTCTQEGEVGNGYLVGEISTLVKPLPYVKSVQNTTISSGGADVESDDAYAERIHLAPESFSTAGPELAYVYWAKTASQNIEDVIADTPAEGEVDVVVLMKDGQLPTEEDLATVEKVLSRSDVRPLTDKVTVSAPGIVEYEAVAEYWISKSNETVSSIIQNQVNQAFQDYLLWQRSKLGRDVDLSELIARLKRAGASRVSVKSTMFIEVAKTEVAKETVTSLTYRGIADD